MASVTLEESAKLSQDQMVIGLIESIKTVSNFFAALPFMGIEGNALLYNRELTIGTVATMGVGEDLGPQASTGNNVAERQAAKDAATFTQVTSGLTKIIGDAEVDQMIQQTRSNMNDQTEVQIASKAKASGRKYNDMLINGVAGANNEFAGLINLVPASQKVATGANGSALTFEILDELLDKPQDKDGLVDYLMMTQASFRAFKALLRTLGGAGVPDVVQLSNGMDMPSYGGVPIFLNNYIPADTTKGATANTTTIFAGNFDDGSQTIGISGLTAQNQMGLHVEDVGISETKDERIWRVKWYCGLALFSELGVASADGIIN
jgi:hypothetical protein